MIEFKSILISATSLTPITDQECTQMSCFFTSRRQQDIQGLDSILPTYCLHVPYSSYHTFGALNLLASFWPYIWPLRTFLSQNHTNHNLPSIFVQTASNSPGVFDACATTISTLHSVARRRSFGRLKYNIGDLRAIREKARRRGS